jgi:hypothetical protein
MPFKSTRQSRQQTSRKIGVVFNELTRVCGVMGKESGARRGVNIPFLQLTLNDLEALSPSEHVLRSCSNQFYVRLRSSMV